jgi:hypothetical protein
MTKLWWRQVETSLPKSQSEVELPSIVASFAAASMAFPGRLVWSDTQQCNRVPCLAEVEHLLQNLQIARWSSMCPWASAGHLGSLCQGCCWMNGRIWWVTFSCVQAIEAMEAVFENYVFIHEGTSSWSLNKLPVGINHRVVWCVIMETLRSARNLLIINFVITFTSSKFTQMIYHALISSLGSFLQHICIAEIILSYCQSRDGVQHLSLKFRRWWHTKIALHCEIFYSCRHKIQIYVAICLSDYGCCEMPLKYQCKE